LNVERWTLDVKNNDQTSEEFMNTETKPAYSPGLAGVIAGETEICWVDPDAGLMYRGYDIHEMAEKANFEEVAISFSTASCRRSNNERSSPPPWPPSVRWRSKIWRCCG
jgi:citrate synthase